MAEAIDLPIGYGLVQSYSPGCANVPWWEVTLAPPGDYDWTVRLRRRCGLMSNYFDHLLPYSQMARIARLENQCVEL